MNTRGQRNSVGGIRCESIENQGPEAVHEGDLYVRQDQGLCVAYGHFPEKRMDGDAQVMARKRKSKR